MYLSRSRLGLTLTFLSHRVDVQCLAWSWKMGKVRRIILETCSTIWETLFSIYVSEPTVTDFELIADDFQSMWDLPNCIGSIDGKHIAIMCPRNSGEQYFNYKKFYSIVLMAACDARYSFTYVDLGSYGGNSDGGVFAHSSFGKRIVEKTLNVPRPKPLPNSNDLMPHFFVADAAFPLSYHIMKPYPGQNLAENKEIYNKRISRARRVIENAFGILAARWRVLLSTLHFEPDNTEKIILACIALHNFIMLDAISRETYCAPTFVDWVDSNGVLHNGEWRQDSEVLESLTPSSTTHRYNGMAAT